MSEDHLTTARWGEAIHDALSMRQSLSRVCAFEDSAQGGATVAWADWLPVGRHQRLRSSRQGTPERNATIGNQHGVSQDSRVLARMRNFSGGRSADGDA